MVSMTAYLLLLTNGQDMRKNYLCPIDMLRTRPTSGYVYVANHVRQTIQDVSFDLLPLGI